VTAAGSPDVPGPLDVPEPVAGGPMTPATAAATVGTRSRVTVIGWDGRPLTVDARAALAAATLVVGGRRHLDTLAEALPAGVRTVVLGDVHAGIREVNAHLAAGAGPVAVLASGDPGFFGIYRTLWERIDADAELDVLPAASSVTLAFGRAGLPWQDAMVVSAHGRRLDRAVNVCRAHPVTAVLTGPKTNPAVLGAALAGLPGLPRRLFVAEDLGGPTERTGWYTPEEAAGRADWREPNVVIVVETSHPHTSRDNGLIYPMYPRRTSPPAWALAEEAFEHRDSMITKVEVRALVLARLGPGPGDLVWDVGTGSGSVAVECAVFGAAVIAVDRAADAVARVTANAAARRVPVQVIQGEAPDVLTGLPDPDAVFVGGGGPDVVAACAARSRRFVVVALAAVDRVRPTWEALAAGGLEVDGTQLAASRLRSLPDGALRLAATNPVTVVWGVRTTW
jgi:precorrin-6B C5,15-methyltransferase / cobalt-precorrin-6B C5,C15-methyltransferase